MSGIIIIIEVCESNHSFSAEPPTKPTDLEFLRATKNSITISWRYTPVRSDDYFVICYMDLNFFDVITCEEDLHIPASSCSESCEYTTVGLIPFTKYVLTVSARNGVSDMDSEMMIAGSLLLIAKLQREVSMCSLEHLKTCTYGGG